VALKVPGAGAATKCSLLSLRIPTSCDFHCAMRAGAQYFVRQQLSALPTSYSAAGWRPDIVRFLFRLCRLFYFSGLLAVTSNYGSK